MFPDSRGSQGVSFRVCELLSKGLYQWMKNSEGGWTQQGSQVNAVRIGLYPEGCGELAKCFKWGSGSLGIWFN